MSETLKSWAPLPLRLILGISFIFHGFPKVSSTIGHQGFAGMLASIGVPKPDLMAWVVGGIEVVGGLALILGAFVAIASVLLITNMLVALFKVHLASGFSFVNIKSMGPDGPVFGMPGYEVNLLFIAALLALLLGGAGALSVDGVRKKKK
jgi:putative oxidoreductase